MLIFETNTPIAQQDLALILKSPPHMYVHNHGNDDRRDKWRWHTSIFKQKPTRFTQQLCETKQNRRNSPIKKKQCNLGVRFEPFPLLEFSPPLESCSDIYVGPTACLIVTLLFNVLFLWYFPLFYLPLSIYSRSANIRPVHANWALSSLYHYKTRPLTTDWLQVCFGIRSNAVVKSVFQKSLHAPLTVAEVMLTADWSVTVQCFQCKAVSCDCE